MENSLPKYNSQIGALQIRKIRYDSDGSAMIHPIEKEYASFYIDAGLIRQHSPRVGGYYIIYQDGHKSYLPMELFESNYMLIKQSS